MQRELYSFRDYLFLVILIALTACGGSSSDSASDNPTNPNFPDSFTYQAPSPRGDGWETASAVDLGMDVSLIENMVNRIYDNDFGFRRMDGVVIVKDNQLIFDTLIRTELDVADGWASNNNLSIHAVHSVTKSVMSLSMGIAIEQGLVGSVEDSALSYFPSYAPYGSQTELKQSMTIKNWLTMQSGFAWDEWNVNYQDDSNQNLRMINASDPLSFLFTQPMGSQPGTDYAYSTGVSYALGEIIARTSDMNLLQFMQLNLFQPLRISQIDHWVFHGDVHGGSGLYLTMRDMAKLGQLILDNGQWQGQQVVPQSWIEESTQQQVVSGTIRYAYQWWITDFSANGQNYHCIYASGWGGQQIFVLPELNAVVVLTGHRYEDGQAEQTSVRDMMQDYILPMILSAG